MRSHRALCVVMSTVSLLFSGCGSDAATWTGDHRHDESTARFQLSAAQIEALIEAAPEAQQPYVEDGEVTPAERERAYLEYLACVEAQGMTVASYHLSPHGGDGSEIAYGDLDPDEAGRIDTACRSEHYVEVGAVYEFHNRMSVEERAELDERIAECMRTRGFDVVEGATLEHIRAIDRAQAIVCSVRAE